MSQREFSFVLRIPFIEGFLSFSHVIFDSHEELRGTGVALITPFDENNQVDVKALERLIQYQIDNGVDYLVALGTTGETATLSKEEKCKRKDCYDCSKLPLWRDHFKSRQTVRNSYHL